MFGIRQVNNFCLAAPFAELMEVKPQYIFKKIFIQFKQESYKKHTNAFINSFTVTQHSQHISHLYST